MLNKKICLAGSASNTGFGDCYLDIKNIVGLFLVAQGTEISEEDLDDLDNYLFQKVNANNADDRFYPVHNFVQVTDNSEDIQLETFGYGGKSITREGDYDWTFKFINGGVCLSNSLRRFNQAKKDVFFIDANGILFGSKVGNKLRSVPLTLFFAPPWGVNDGQNSTNYGIRVSFPPRFVNENLGFVDTSPLGLILSTYKGLQNLILLAVDPENAPVVKIRTVAGCDRRNLFASLNAELEAVALWKAYGVNGEAVTVESVTADQASETYIVTVSGATGNYYIELISPLDLAEAGVQGFESKRVLIEYTPA
jgi:hypothetical protein